MTAFLFIQKGIFYCLLCMCRCCNFREELSMSGPYNLDFFYKVTTINFCSTICHVSREKCAHTYTSGIATNHRYTFAYISYIRVGKKISVVNCEYSSKKKNWDSTRIRRSCCCYYALKNAYGEQSYWHLT